MVSISAGIIAVSSFLPQATLIVNATPGIRVRLVEMKDSGDFVPAKSFVNEFMAGNRPRRFSIRTSDDTKALCAQTIPVEGGPNTVSVVYRSCAFLQ